MKRQGRLLVRLGLGLGLPFVVGGTWAALSALPAHAVGCTTSWKTAVSGMFTDATKWDNGAPTATSVACIVIPGTYTVTLNGNNVVTKGLVLGSGTHGDHEELDVQGVACGINQEADYTVTSTATVHSTGEIDLTSAGCGSSNANLTVGTLVSSGILQSDVGSAGSRSITGNVTNNGGQVNINQPTTWSGPGTFDNKGTLTIADNLELLAAAHSGATFTNDTGGSVVTTGDATTGDLRLADGNVFNEAGTSSGSPMYVDNSTLNYTGSGASSINVRGSAGGGGTLTGNMAHGQTLTVLGTACAINENSDQTLTTNMTNAGSIELTSTGCGAANDTLTVASGSTLTNGATGVIQTDGGAGGSRTLSGNLTNNGGHVNLNVSLTYSAVAATWDNGGTINLADGQALGLDAPAVGTGPTVFTNDSGGVIAAPGTSGTGLVDMANGNIYNEGAGTSTAAVYVDNSTLNYTGSGASSINVRGSAGGGGTLTGNMAHGQTLTVLGTACAINENSDQTLTTNMTNAGTIELTSTGCGAANDTLTVATGKALTLTSTGLFQIDPGAGGTRTITGNVTNTGGQVNINQPTTWSGPGTFDNNGTMTIADNLELLGAAHTGATFTNDTAGSVVTTGDATTGDLRVADGNVFNEAGTSTGWPMYVDNSTLNYTGTGGSSITARGNNSGGTITGNMAAGQTLTVLGTGCGLNEGSSQTITSNMTNGGTIDLTTTGCGATNDLLTIGSGKTLTLTSSGILQTDKGAAGKRQIRGNITSAGHFNVNTSTAWDGRGTFDNSGTVTTVHGLSVGAHGVFTNEASGTIVNKAGFTVGTGSTFNEAGTTNHRAILVDNGVLHYFGSGSSAISARGSSPGVTLTGNIAAGQTLSIVGTACTLNQAALVTLGASLTNAGTIDLTSAGCGAQSDTLAIPSGDVLTNTGTIQTDSGANGPRTITGDIQNGILSGAQGSVVLNVSLTYVPNTLFDNLGSVTIADGQSLSVPASASVGPVFFNDLNGSIVTTGDASTGALILSTNQTFKEGAGTTSGGPVYVQNGITDYTGSGASSISAMGSGGQGAIEGNVAHGQTFTVLGQGCGLNQSAVISAPASFSDAGIIVITSNGCGATNASLNLPANGTLTVSANGMLTSLPGAGGSRTLGGNLINNGQVFPGGVTTLNVTGNYTQGASGSIHANVASGPSSDRLAVSGTAHLAGSAVAVPVSGFTPPSGTTFTLLTATSVVGTWSSVSGPGGTWTGAYTASTAGVTSP